MSKHLVSVLASAVLALSAQFAVADEAAIRKSIAERLPDFPKIDEVSKTPIAGIYELRIGSEVLYTDEQGNYLIEGSLIDTKTRSNLTEARISKLTAIDFSKLPLKDAIVWKQGSGARKLVVFADPNCGYCKKFERDLQQVKDVTVYTFLYPILGATRPTSRATSGARRSHQGLARLDDRRHADPGECGSLRCVGLQRNVALGRKYRITGTPGLVFEDGTHKPGAVPCAQVEQLLVAAKSKN
jgi:thiol:disulfide interchange protein DsbC